MSGRFDDQTHLHPSPEKELLVERKPFFMQQDHGHDQDKQQQQQEQQEKPHQIVTSPCGSSPRRRESSAACTDRWEPSEEEIRALAMRDFDVIGVLGVGTYGVVKLAKHIESGASVALKVLSKEHVVSMRQEKHILRERMVHLQLKHAFIARLYGTFQDEDCLYLVIEYLPGGELWSLVYSDFDNNNDGNEDCGNGSENESVATAKEAAVVSSAQEEDADDELGRVTESLQTLSVSEPGKDTEARGGTPTETDESTGVLNIQPAKLAINVVLNEPTYIAQQQDHQQQTFQPRRRRLSSSGFLPPNSPTRVMRLDAKSRGLLRNNHGGLREDHAVFYLACILRALEYLHARDLLYRDLKLENLVLDRSGYPKVLDFGFAKPNAAGKSGRNMTLCGSMDYMAPEILLHEPHDQRVDIWSFGVIMYEMLLGKTPFYHENARELGRKIMTEPVAFPNEFEEDHPAACELIGKLLVKKPEDRLKCMQELKSHAFFRRLFPDAEAWDALEQKERPAPFVPKLAGPFDTSFFQTIDDDTQDELDDYVEPYFEDGSYIFSAF